MTGDTRGTGQPASCAVAVGSPADFPPGTLRSLDAAGHRLCVGNDDGHLFALDDRCLHRGGSLGLGRLVGGRVTCPRHWWRFDVRTGAMVGRPGSAVQTFAVQVDDDVVVVTVPVTAAAAARGWNDLLREHARTATPGPHAGAAPAPRSRPDVPGEPVDRADDERAEP